MIAKNTSLADILAPYSAAFDIIECEDEAAWLSERNNGIGASDVAILLGLSDWGSPVSLWAQKTGRMDAGASDAEYLEWGRFAEDGIAKRYAYRTKRELLDLGRFTILRSKRWPWLFCTLDRIVTSLPADGIGAELYPPKPFIVGLGACEIKQATLYGFRAWDEGVPLKVQSQLQTQLAVTGLGWGSVAATMPDGKFDAVDCERNEAFIEVVVEKSRVFMECVQTDTWPPVDGSDWTSQALKAIYPKSNGSVVDLPFEAAEWHKKLQAAKAAKKESEAVESLYGNKLRAAIGESLYGRLRSEGEAVFYKYFEVSKDAYTVEASTHRQLRNVKGIK